MIGFGNRLAHRINCKFNCSFQCRLQTLTAHQTGKAGAGKYISGTVERGFDMLDKKYNHIEVEKEKYNNNISNKDDLDTLVDISIKRIKECMELITLHIKISQLS